MKRTPVSKIKKYKITLFYNNDIVPNFVIYITHTTQHPFINK